MFTTFYDKRDLKYDGTQLHSHFALEQYKVFGNSLVSFCGPCEVKLSEMVDIEDVINNEPISCDRMAHFILEIFDKDLEKAVLYQRLLITQIYKYITENFSIKTKMCGDDIYCSGRKLSVSIATVSRVSAMCHTGINISKTGAPIEIASLQGLKIDEKKFIKEVLDKFKEEYIEIQRAMSKVNPV